MQQHRATHPALKLRLGNECDFYGEFRHGQDMKTPERQDREAVLMTHCCIDANNSRVPDTTCGTSYGAQVEIWF